MISAERDTRNRRKCSEVRFINNSLIVSCLFSGTKRCFGDQWARCRPLKNEVSDFVCIEKGYSLHATDCTKFYRCSNVNNQPCICRCRHKNMFLDLNSGKCGQINEANACGMNKKFKVKAKDKDFLGGLKKENDIIKSMSELSKEQEAQVAFLHTTVSHLELNTVNITSEKILIIDDNFPVWAISLAVSAAVTIAVGIILFFYWRTAPHEFTTQSVLLRWIWAIMDDIFTNHKLFQSNLVAETKQSQFVGNNLLDTLGHTY